MPEVDLIEIEDYYTYYVHILGIDEYTFWNGDLYIVHAIAKSIEAYTNWKNYAQERMISNGSK